MIIIQSYYKRLYNQTVTDIGYYCKINVKEVFIMSGGYGYGGGFALIVVLFILLIIVGAAWF